jgi:4-hydroxy-tetrahydrodipicolinate reductase
LGLVTSVHDDVPTFPTDADSVLPVAVIGAHGRMGRTVVSAVEGAAGMRVAAAVDVGWSEEEVAASGARVAVDFTTPAVTESTVHTLIDLGIHAVVGTTGWDGEALGRVRKHADARAGIGVLIAPNFALGAVLAMRFAAVAGRYFDSAEVIELHHPNKVDAPSGTARHTAAAIAAARSSAHLGPVPDATTTGVDGARGAEVDGIRVHSVRLTGLIAHEEILFGNPGEQLTVRHDSFDRASFMPGVLLGVREVARHPGLTVGLDAYLDL